MIRYVSTLMLAISLALAPCASVRAQDFHVQPIHEADNPYAQGLKDARKAYEEAYERYRVAAQQAYWSWSHYQAYYRAYYELYSAYSRYVWYQRAHDWYEAQGIRFAGRVLADPAGTPLAGAEVQLSTTVPPGSRAPIRLIGTRTSDNSGRFEFNGLSQGRFAWSVSKPGYASRSGTVEVRQGTTRLDIRIRASRGIHGVVLTRPLYGILPADPPAHFFDPRPLAGAKVTIYRSDVVYIVAPGPNHTVITGADGRFDIPDANYESARVIIEKDSYRTHTENVDLTRGPSNLRVVLEYNGPPPPIAQPVGPSHDDINRN